MVGKACMKPVVHKQKENMKRNPATEPQRPQPSDPLSSKTPSPKDFIIFPKVQTQVYGETSRIQITMIYNANSEICSIKS